MNTKAQINKTVFMIIFMGLSALVFCFPIAGFAQDRPVLSSVAKEVQGEISALDKHGVAIILKRDKAKGEENEIYIPFDKDGIRFIHKKGLSEINVGDIVKVGYETILEEDKEGRKISRFSAKTITFVKPAENKPQLLEPTQEEDDQPVDEPLPLKGVK